MSRCASARAPRARRETARRAREDASRADPRDDDATTRRRRARRRAGATTRARATTGDDPDAPTAGFASVADALEDVAKGKFVVVLDDEDRENEGDLIGAADKMTAESLAFMIRHTSGLVCVSLEDSRADALDLPLMVDSQSNKDAMKTAFTVSVDLATSTTGISASERAMTINALGIG